MPPTGVLSRRFARPSLHEKFVGGNRTRQDADTQQVLASVARTIDQRSLDLTAVLTTILQAPQPIVPPALQRRPQ